MKAAVAMWKDTCKEHRHFQLAGKVRVQRIGHFLKLSPSTKGVACAARNVCMYVSTIDQWYYYYQEITTCGSRLFIKLALLVRISSRAPCGSSRCLDHFDPSPCRLRPLDLSPPLPLSSYCCWKAILQMYCFSPISAQLWR